MTTHKNENTQTVHGSVLHLEPTEGEASLGNFLAYPDGPTMVDALTERTAQSMQESWDGDDFYALARHGARGLASYSEDELREEWSAAYADSYC